MLPEIILSLERYAAATSWLLKFTIPDEFAFDDLPESLAKIKYTKIDSKHGFIMLPISYSSDLGMTPEIINTIFADPKITALGTTFCTHAYVWFVSMLFSNTISYQNNSLYLSEFLQQITPDKREELLQKLRAKLLKALQGKIYFAWKPEQGKDFFTKTDQENTMTKLLAIFQEAAFQEADYLAAAIEPLTYPKARKVAPFSKRTCWGIFGIFSMLGIAIAGVLALNSLAIAAIVASAFSAVGIGFALIYTFVRAKPVAKSFLTVFLATTFSVAVTPVAIAFGPLLLNTFFPTSMIFLSSLTGVGIATSIAAWSLPLLLVIAVIVVATTIVKVDATLASSSKVAQLPTKIVQPTDEALQFTERPPDPPSGSPTPTPQ